MYIQTILDLLKYNPEEPLIFTNGLFLFLFAIFAIFYYAWRENLNRRIIYVILFSLYFYYKTSGFYFLLLILVSIWDCLLGILIHKSGKQLNKRIYLAISVCLNLSLLGYFKYTGFLMGIFSTITNGNLEFENIFLPIGISFFTFQSMSYVIDIYRGRIAPLRLYIDYLFYISFFPQLVAGPIVRARDFIPQITRKLYVSREMFGTGIFLICTGIFKKSIISDYIGVNFVDRIFDNPLLYSGFENLLGVYGYALQIYCDFSGYSDIAIGLALLLGFHFNKNFDSPYKSATITEFWRRWHISLSSWLKDYLYISLGGNRKGNVRTYINLIITMLLGGLWHGAALRFILWGALHGISLAVHKFTMGLFSGFKAQGIDMPRWRRLIGVFVTFHIVCLGWILFRAETLQTGVIMVQQIFTKFGFNLIPDVIIGYKYVLLFILVGYLLHFMPDKWEQRSVKKVIDAPIWTWIIMIVIIIWAVMQIKSADIQPFIYFQF